MNLLLKKYCHRSTRNIVKAAQKIISDQTSSSNSNQDLSRQDMKPMRGKGPLPRILSCADSQAEGMFDCYFNRIDVMSNFTVSYLSVKHFSIVCCKGN